MSGRETKFYYKKKEYKNALKNALRPKTPNI